jgi:hypothetical protein
MEIIQILGIVFALFAFSRAYLRFKDNKLTKNEFIFWVLIWFVVIAISLAPNILGLFSNILGIGRGMDLIIVISIVVLFYLIFRLYVQLEGVKKEITTLVRRVALEGKNKKKK